MHNLTKYLLQKSCDIRVDRSLSQLIVIHVYIYGYVCMFVFSNSLLVV